MNTVGTVPTVPTVIETCGLLAPFDDMDALRHFSNHVYFKYMGNCRRKEPPRDWVKSLVNENEDNRVLRLTVIFHDRNLKENENRKDKEVFL